MMAEAAPERRTSATTPKGLGPRGRKFWGAVAETFDLSAPESELLLETCRTLDACENLQSQVDASGGKATAALRELRQQRLAAGRMLAQLNIPDSAIESPSTLRARKAAEVRWAGHERRRPKR